jgi:hypothetical protein
LSDIKMLSQVPGTTTYNAILEGIVLWMMMY